MMTKILECLKRVFPEANLASITGDTLLREVPGWDSMNSVNLMMELEQACGVALFDKDVVLQGDHSVAQLVALIEGLGGVAT